MLDVQKGTNLPRTLETFGKDCQTRWTTKHKGNVLTYTNEGQPLMAYEVFGDVFEGVALYEGDTIRAAVIWYYQEPAALDCAESEREVEHGPTYITPEVEEGERIPELITVYAGLEYHA